MEISILEETTLLHNIRQQKNPFHEKQYAFYSSWFGGILKDPTMMLLPIDDHMVHRGDGVFEAMKAVNRSVYLLEEHLQRLFRSAEKISIQSPFTAEEIKDIILQTLRVADRSDVTIRLFLSRGPGGFSTNPYDPSQAQLYIVITSLKIPAAEKYTAGVTLGKSAIPAKSSWMAQIKSCNYLPNVLMHKEALDRHLDYVVGVDDNGYITEAPTENVMIVDNHGVLAHPQWNTILKGTTLTRICELAENANLTVEARPIALTELATAREILITGTSLNVLPVTQFEGQAVGTGRPGPIAQQLNELMRQDIASGVRGTKY